MCQGLFERRGSKSEGGATRLLKGGVPPVPEAVAERVCPRESYIFL